MRFLVKSIVVMVAALVGLLVGTLLALLPIWPEFIREVLPAAAGFGLGIASADLPILHKDRR